MRIIYRQFFVSILLGTIFTLASMRARCESLEIETLFSTSITPVNGVHPLWTPVQHCKGKTFVVVPDVNLRPMVTQIDRDGKTTTVPLDPSPDYTASPDGHNRFTMGIDESGYIHISGDMHGFAPWARTYVGRYQRQNMMYWRSNKALDVSGGFTFTGGLNSAAALPGEEWGGDSRFFNDRNGVLYYSSRVRAFKGSRLSGSEPFIAYGLYRYNCKTGLWQSMGGSVENEVEEASDFNKVLYWEHTNSFEAYQCAPRFDNKNRLHFAIAGNTAGTKGQGLIYGISADGGETWKKADGTSIPGLPLRGKDGHANQGDLVLRSEKVAQQSPVYIDKSGNAALNIAGVWKRWNGKEWVEFKGGVGFLGPDDMMTGEGGPVLTRTTEFGQPPVIFNTGFGQVFSLSELGIQVENAVYGVGLPPGTNFVSARKMSVFKAVFTNLENLAVNGQATASSDSQGAAMAFDRNKGSKWYTGQTEPGWWLQYSFSQGKKYKISSYELTSGNDMQGRDPKDWSLEGSVDGSNWQILDKRSDELFENRQQTKKYNLTNSTSFGHFRLKVSANRGGEKDSLQLGELALLGVDESERPAIPKIYYSAADDARVWLSWTTPAGAVSYKVKRAIKSKGPFKVIASEVTKNGEFIDKTCKNGVTYFYKISAVNSAGESPDSQVLQISPQQSSPLPPVILSANGKNCGMEIHWLPLWTDGVSYTVKRSTAIDGPYKVIAKNIKNLSYRDFGLINGRNYFYKVSAVDAGSRVSEDSKAAKGTPFQWVSVLKYKSIGYSDPGKATASSENAPRETAAGAFDDSLSSKWLMPARTGWLQYSFERGHGRVVTRYSLISGQDAPDRDPKGWTFQGSVDGNSWIDLDTQKDQQFSQRNAVLTFKFQNSKSFQYYRLKITGNNGSGITQLAELQLWADGKIVEK